MAFAQSSFYNQSPVLRINVLVVDDDPIFLQIMSRMLEKSKHRDPSVMEITVIAAKDPMEALSALKIQRNNIDLIITDYYMPGMNGLQLKRQITEEFGNLPVIVMSSDTDKEEESLTCGAISFMPKPIKPNDLPKIYQYALTYKRNGKSIVWTDQQNDKDTNVSVVPQHVPQQIQLLPEQATVVTTKKTKRYTSRSDSRSGSSTNTSCVSTDGSRKNGKRKSNGSSDGDVLPPAKKSKKYRIFLRKVAEQALISSSSVFTGRGIDSNFSYAHITEPYFNYYSPSTAWYDTSLTSRSFYSKPGHGLGQSIQGLGQSIQGLGQSRLLSNTGNSARFDQRTPFNYMNRSSMYEPNRIGSNSTLPVKNNLNFSNQPSQNEGRRSFFEPPVMANKVGQTSPVLGLGPNEAVATKGTSFNNNMMSRSSYGNSTPNQPGLTNYGNSTPNQPGLTSYGPNQPGPISYGSLTPTQSRLMSSYGSLTPNQSGPSSFGGSTPTQSGLMSSYGSSTPNQSGPISFGGSTPTQSGLVSSYGSLTPNQSGPSSYGSLSPNQPEPGSYGSISPNKAGLSSHGSVTPNQTGPSSFGSISPNQPGPSHFSYGMQSFLNNENEAYKPPQPHANAATQPNLEIPQLENLNLYDDLGNINELPWDTSNFQFDHNKQLGEAASTNFELPKFSSEMNQFFSLEDDDDWTFVNIDQGPSNGETSTTLAAPETNSSLFNMNPNQNQEEDVPDFIDWSILDAQELVDDDFMNSVFNNDMN
ncbi:hypothetical protein AALP_AA8G067800 [Arabis alpina]|uniref:Response regulatory domain-containing protein n=1 Tax=Arabis alpina TaxID=50452 RepID=A0A087G5G4_ARAAL|nr:hypothetical protein AALP_AA8G067800 [Arabis alpina]